MSDLGTIRERVQRAASYFHRQEGVVLTTFNLSAAFLEEQALPVVLGVEAKTVAARRAETHQRRDAMLGLLRSDRPSQAVRVVPFRRAAGADARALLPPEARRDRGTR